MGTGLLLKIVKPVWTLGLNFMFLRSGTGTVIPDGSIHSEKQPMLTVQPQRLGTLACVTVIGILHRLEVGWLIHQVLLSGMRAIRQLPLRSKIILAFWLFPTTAQTLLFA